MARTAVVAGTATAVSNRVSRRQANRWDQQQAAAPPQQYAAPPPQYAAPPAAEGAGDNVGAELEKLAALRAQGVLNDEEFAAAKAKLLGI
jgi:hypothetical protein